MTVTLNIQNDEELRAHIKEAIRGQILSITRGEIDEVINKAIVKRVQNQSKYNPSVFDLGTSIQKYIPAAVAEMMKGNGVSVDVSPEYIQNVVTQLVTKMVTDFVNTINISGTIANMVQLNVKAILDAQQK